MGDTKLVFEIFSLKGRIKGVFFFYVGYTVAIVKIYKTYIWTAGKRLINNNNNNFIYITSK